MQDEIKSYYPPLEPYATYRLKVEEPHEIYVEECGNPQGLPILFVHGGPGSGCNENSRRFFDPTIYRIILFDQRGAGRSTPLAELKNNNTPGLVRDMEAIREFLQIKQWALFGGSWGSTLSLLYAEAHPDRVLGLILRGIFLGRSQDLHWLYSYDGARQIFPDHWQKFVAPIPEQHRHFPLPFYYELLTHSDEKIRQQAAITWSNWEATILSLLPREDLIKGFAVPDTALSFARLECHYFINHCFIEPNQILQQLHKINHLPCIIVHGRYDMICLLENAWTLHRAWPDSILNIVANAGHSSSEPGTTAALINATEVLPTLIASDS